MATTTQSSRSVFLTETKTSNEAAHKEFLTPLPSPVDEDFESHKLDVDGVKRRLYKRECTKLGIIPVGAVLREPSRSKVVMKHYNLGPLGARALAVPLLLDSTITVLDLESNMIGSDGLADMFEMLTDSCSITHLNLKQNNLRSRGAFLICQVLCSNRFILSVNLSANEFQDQDGIFFADMLKENRTLKSLDLSENHLDFKSGEALGDALSQTEGLESINLSWNHFREKGAAKLLCGIQENLSLRVLNISHNSFGHGSSCQSPEHLSTLLSASTPIQHLDISNNRLSDIDMFHIAMGLKQNESLETFKIGKNPVRNSFQATSAIIKAVLANECCALKVLDMTDLTVSETCIHDVKTLESRGITVMHGIIHQLETNFNANAC